MLDTDLTTIAANHSLLILCSVAVLMVGVPGCGSTERTTEIKVSTLTALGQAEVAFLGGYSKAEIKTRLDRALNLYGLPATEENYSRAGSALVALRKANGTPEMAILDHMIRSYVSGVRMSFPEAAGMSSAFLKAGDR